MLCARYASKEDTRIGAIWRSVPHYHTSLYIFIGCPHLSPELPLLTASTRTHTIPTSHPNFFGLGEYISSSIDHTNHQPNTAPRRHLEIADEPPSRWVRYFCARYHIQVACVRLRDFARPEMAPCCVLGYPRSFSRLIEAA